MNDLVEGAGSRERSFWTDRIFSKEMDVNLLRNGWNGIPETESVSNEYL